MKTRLIAKATTDILRGQVMFWGDGSLMGFAARDISEGEVIKYNPACNTEDVILRVSKSDKEQQEARLNVKLKCGGIAFWDDGTPVGADVREYQAEEFIDRDTLSNSGAIVTDKWKYTSEDVDCTSSLYTQDDAYTDSLYTKEELLIRYDVELSILGIDHMLEELLNYCEDTGLDPDAVIRQIKLFSCMLRIKGPTLRRVWNELMYSFKWQTDVLKSGHTSKALRGHLLVSTLGPLVGDVSVENDEVFKLICLRL